MGWIIIFFLVFLTLGYVVLALVFPEWVGLTGKKAVEIQKHQHPSDDFGDVHKH